MKISERLAQGQPTFSFEFFPPNTERGVESLFRTVVDLEPLNPAFVSVTYPGSAALVPDDETRRKRALTLELTRRIRDESGIEAMAHLTCSGHTRDELCTILDQLKAEGAENVLALRGDPPPGGRFVAVEGGFSHGAELIRLIDERDYGFCIGAAAYPEKHQESPDWESELRHVREKVEAGAQFLTTQLFFDNSAYFAYIERIRAAGIGVPVLAGLMPVTSARTRARMPFFGASIPPALAAALDACGDDDEGVLAVGVAHTTRQAQELVEAGAPGIHFYTLNTSRATRAIVSSLMEQM
ncbi:MAG: methylenetetrahydrofolate reductase [Candidatus Dormibacteria bacterium]